MGKQRRTRRWRVPPSRCLPQKLKPLGKRSCSVVLTGFARRPRLDGEGVQATLEALGQEVVDEPMTIESALALEGSRHDIKTEVSFAAFAPAGMTVVLVRFVRYDEMRRLEPLLDRLRYPVLHSHSSTFRPVAGWLSNRDGGWPNRSTTTDRSQLVKRPAA